ncbi:MAG: 5'-nucleotidase [Acetatifactor sp.]|nr:5'-nucleotidase [Acetatifactor sp.]
MAYKVDNCMVIGVSSRALFDMTKANEVFETEGVEAYRKYQYEHEDEVLKPGPGFALVKSLLGLNELSGGEKLVEVIIMSHNSNDTSLRVFNSIRHFGLDITRAVLSGGASLAPYLEAFHTDLFLSAYEDDVQAAIDSGIAAGIICTDNLPKYDEDMAVNCVAGCMEQIRIAFDGDAVIFTDDSEKIFKEKGLEAFEENERLNAQNPLGEGPFAKFLKKLSAIQARFEGQQSPIRTALVTSRSAPAHERVIRTLRSWNVRIDESFFLGGIEKKDVLKAFGAQIFFDDQSIHTIPASKEVPAARVPYKNDA